MPWTPKRLKDTRTTLDSVPETKLGFGTSHWLIAILVFEEGLVSIPGAAKASHRDKELSL